MGVRASMTVVPAALFRRHKAKLSDLRIPEGATSFALDKAWLELHMALRGMPKPLSLAISGDHAAYGRLEGGLIRPPAEAVGDDDWDDENDDEGEECYLGYMSPLLVKKISQALNNLPDDALLVAMKEAGWPVSKREQKYYKSIIQELKNAYRGAAAEGAAMQIFID